MAQVQLPKLPETTPEQLEKLIADLKEKVIAGFATYSKKIEQAEVDRLTDAEYLRFIRARKLNLNDAYDMIMNALAWRTEMKPREIEESDIASEYKKGKVWLSGYDKAGRIICYIRVKTHDPSDSDFETMKKLCVWMIEYGLTKAKAESPYTCMIFDMDGFSLFKMDYKFVKFIVDVFANYYPETLGCALILNSPWIFSGCWKLIKPWLDPVTACKVIFCKTADVVGWIEPQYLYKELGGEFEVDFSNYVPPKKGERHEVPTPIVSKRESKIKTRTDSNPSEASKREEEDMQDKGATVHIIKSEGSTPAAKKKSRKAKDPLTASSSE